MLPSASASRAFIFGTRPRQDQLEAGQLGINAADGTAWTKLLSNQIVPLRSLAFSTSGGDGGGVSPPYELPIATATVLGGVKIGAGIQVTAEGVISTQPYQLPIASTTILGGVRIGSGISVGPDGTISAAPQAGTGTDLGYAAATMTVTSSTGIGARLVLFDASVPGLVPVSPGGTAAYLRADRTWAVPPVTPLSDAIDSQVSSTGASSKAVATLNTKVQQERVAKVGDAMTGTLTMTNQGAVHCALGSYFSAIAARNSSDWLYARSDDNYTDFGVRFTPAGNAWLASRTGIYLNADPVAIRIAGGGEFDFTSGYCYFNRSTYINPTGTDVGIDLRANTNDQSWLRFTSPDGANEYGSLTVNWARADYWGRKETWLRGGVSDPTGWVELNGGWNQWEAVRFSRGNTHLGSIDGNGNYVKKTGAVLALRAATPGLAAIEQIQPVAFAAQTQAASASQNTYGFLPDQLRQVVPEAVTPDGAGYSSEVLIPVLVKAMQELAARVRALEGA